MTLPMPKRVPEMGFYYHYKHDPEKGVGHHAYDVVGVIFHTEDDPRPGEAHFVSYLPLDREAEVYQAAQELGVRCFDGRPLEMWMEDVEKDGKTFPRFSRITDPAIIAELERIRSEMY